MVVVKKCLRKNLLGAFAAGAAMVKSAALPEAIPNETKFHVAESASMLTFCRVLISSEMRTLATDFHPLPVAPTDEAATYWFA